MEVGIEQSLGKPSMTIYRAYLLRLWVSDSEATDKAGWRASLEDSHTGERLGFASLEQLFAFLIASTEAKKGQESSTDANQMPE
jgi:hypothetical protein